MTYGWVIMVALVAIGALAQFGVLSPDKFLPRKCILEAGIACMDFKVNENSAVLVLRNAKGEDITISKITAGGCYIDDPGILKNTEQKTFTVTGCSNEADKKFFGEINISYTAESGLAHILKGSISDKVESGTSETESGTQTIELSIDSDTLNYNIFEEADSPIEAVSAVLTISPGVKVGSSSTPQAAMATGIFPPGSSLSIINNGNIVGAGGSGGSYPGGKTSGNPGSNGGPALEINFEASIENNGIIGGGGGGGGAGGGSSCSECYDDPGAAGGGGAGYDTGSGGVSTRGGSFTGSAGSTLTGGAGGTVSYQGSNEYWMAGNGGNGGNLGSNGQNGQNGQGYSGGTGGIAGAAVIGNNFVTWTLQGDIRGSLE